MTSNAQLPLKLREAMAIIQSAGNDNGWMSEEDYRRTQSELGKLGITVFTTVEDYDDDDDDEAPVMDKHGRTFFEVSIHPFVQQVADEDGEPVDGDWVNSSGSVWNNEFGDDLDGYPDAMFRKGWSVSSWVGTPILDEDGDLESYEDIEDVDDEEFPDYDTAIARAGELAAQYRVDIDHRY